MAFTVAGRVFRYRCDCSEMAWQLCRSWLDSAGGGYKNCRIVKIDDAGYGVYDNKGKTWEYTAEVLEKQ